MNENNIYKKINKDCFVTIPLIGKSGSGKDYVRKKLLEYDSKKYKILHNVVRCTTRPARVGETKEDYSFISEEEITKLILENKLCDCEKFNGWYYGTPFDSFKKHSLNIVVCNPCMLQSLKQNNSFILFPIFIEASDKIRMERMIKRSPDVSESCRRFLQDNKDFQELDEDEYFFTWFPNEQEGNQENIEYLYSLITKWVVDIQSLVNPK